MQKVSDIFRAWPSLKEFTRDVGVPYQTAAAWKSRESIASDYWLAIVRAAIRRGHPEITADLLARLHAREPTDLNGFAEEGTAMSSSPGKAEGARKQTGHFSRWKHLRVPHYSTTSDVARHIDALRDEWEHR